MLHPPSSGPLQWKEPPGKTVDKHVRETSAPRSSPGRQLRSPTPPRGVGKDKSGHAAPPSPASSVGSQGPRQGRKVSFTEGPAETRSYNPTSPTTSVTVPKDQAPSGESGPRAMKKRRKKDWTFARREAAGRKGQSKGKKGRGKGKGKGRGKGKGK